MKNNKTPSLNKILIVRPLVLTGIFLLAAELLSLGPVSAGMLTLFFTLVYGTVISSLKNHGYLRPYPDPKIALVRRGAECRACEGNGYFVDSDKAGFYHEETCFSCKGSGRKSKASIKNKAA